MAPPATRPRRLHDISAEKLAGRSRLRYRPAVSQGTIAAAAWLLGGLLLTGVPRPAAAEPTSLPAPLANTYGDQETARSAGVGGALRATGSGTTGMFQNPASMALTRVYHLEGIAQYTPETERVMVGAVIVDSIMNRQGLAGGLAVLGGVLDNGLDWSTLDVRTGFAVPIGDRLFLGIGGRYAKMGQGSANEAPREGGASDATTLSLNAFTFDAGLTLKATDLLHIAVVGQNLGTTNVGTFPRMVGGGIGVATAGFTLEVDALADLSSYEETTARFMGGAEVLVANHVPLRLGYQFDQGASLHWLTAGVGYVGTEFAVEGALRRTLSSEQNASSIVLSLAYFLESTGLIQAATEGR